MRYFVRNEVCQLLPRKFKVAFTASDKDRAITLIHDLGFIPRVRDGVRGVEMRVGGGTSIMPRVAPTLYDFVEVDNGDYLKVSEAVLRVFDRRDELRANRQRARLKFYVDKIGIDAFRELVEEELQGDWVAERDFDPTPLLFLHDEEAKAPRCRSRPAPQRRRPRLRPLRGLQRALPAPGGLLHRRGEGHPRRPDPEQFRGLAQIMRDFTGGYARTTVHQNLVLRWVRDEGPLRRLAAPGRARPGRRRARTRSPTS